MEETARVVASLLNVLIQAVLHCMVAIQVNRDGTKIVRALYRLRPQMHSSIANVTRLSIPVPHSA